MGTDNTNTKTKEEYKCHKRTESEVPSGGWGLSKEGGEYKDQEQLQKE